LEGGNAKNRKKMFFFRKINRKSAGGRMVSAPTKQVHDARGVEGAAPYRRPAHGFSYSRGRKRNEADGYRRPLLQLESNRPSLRSGYKLRSAPAALQSADFSVAGSLRIGSHPIFLHQSKKDGECRPLLWWRQL